MYSYSFSLLLRSLLICLVCRFYEINPKGPWKLKASERELPLLQGIGVQSCIRFSLDGSLLATGGKVLSNFCMLMENHNMSLTLLLNFAGWSPSSFCLAEFATRTG